MTCPLLKVCGLTTIADLRVAQAAGADFLGVVVESPPSPRSLTLAQAAVLVRFAENIVAVTHCDQADRLRQFATKLPFRALQLHGARALELASELTALTKVWVAVGLPPVGGDAEQALNRIGKAAEAGVEMIILDTAIGGWTGGTGQTSDWSIAAEVVTRSPLPVLLAGGIDPDNAAAALAQVQPAGLDASSRLERAPGRKDPARVHALAALVHQEF